jgi:uncharacterized protein (DUF1800 family)
MDPVDLALFRFGLGARPGDRERVGEPRAWLRRQIRPEAALDVSLSKLPSSKERIREAAALDYAEVKRRSPIRYEEERRARAEVSYSTASPFAERWVRHFSNHFTVSTTAGATLRVIGAFEREVVRSHAFGRFADMLVESSRHPAMLLYLDNTRSVGPDSTFVKQAAVSEGRGPGRRDPAKRGNFRFDPRDPSRKSPGLNENLAREILELHTLGADGGYGQEDVRALAMIITGWTVDQRAEYDGGFRYEADRHQPGKKTLLGRAYGEGVEEGERALRDLAAHPSTARNVARRLAKQFRVDDRAAVATLEARFRESGGDLAAVARTLVDLDAAWAGSPVIAAPDDWLTVLVRATGIGTEVAERPERRGGRGSRGAVQGGGGAAVGPMATRAPFVEALRTLGQPTWGAPSPEGWPEDEASWAGPEQLVRRIEVASSLAAIAAGRGGDALGAALQALGPLLPEARRRAVDRAGDRTTALTLCFLAPEVLRR